MHSFGQLKFFGHENSIESWQNANKLINLLLLLLLLLLLSLSLSLSLSLLLSLFPYFFMSLGGVVPSV